MILKYFSWVVVKKEHFDLMHNSFSPRHIINIYIMNQQLAYMCIDNFNFIYILVNIKQDITKYNEE